jgi:hypothetical protein
VALGSCRTSRDAQYTSLSVSAPHQVQLLATSEGFGFCQGITKAGERCCRAVDKTASPYCEYHVLQQQRQVKRDLKGATASGAVAAAAAAAGAGVATVGGPGGGGGGSGSGIEGPGRPLGRTEGLQTAGVPAAVGLTGQERREREAAQLMANRVRGALLVGPGMGLSAAGAGGSPDRAAKLHLLGDCANFMQALQWSTVCCLHSAGLRACGQTARIQQEGTIHARVTRCPGLRCCANVFLQ